VRRRLPLILVVLLCLAAVGAAACGGDDESSGPLDEALAYLPANEPFAVAIETDLDGKQFAAVDDLLGKFPLGVESVEGALADQLEGSRSSIDFERDVKPLLGNPFVVGSSSVSSFLGDSENDDFIAAIQVKDTDALDELIDATGPDDLGERSGATVYEDGGTVFAVEDDMLVLAGSEELLDRALERADGDDHLDGGAFDAALEDLPSRAVARVYADLEGIIASDPDTRDARRVPWVSALRTLGLTASAEEGKVEIEFDLRTDGGELSEEDLPVAPGDDAPGVLEQQGEIGLGIRDLAHTVTFAESAGQAVNPSGFGDYEQAKRTLDKRLGISIDDDLIGQLTANLAATIAVDGSLGVRSQLSDPDAFERTLAKVADVLPSFAEGAGFGAVALRRPKGDNRFYALAQADGDAVVFGVVDGSFVLADDARRAGELVSAEPTSVPGAQGAIAMSADAQALVNSLLSQLGPQLGLGGVEGLGAQLFTGPLEDLTGSVQSSTDGLRGRVSLAVD
jgi:hypothetical protein